MKKIKFEGLEKSPKYKSAISSVEYSVLANKISNAKKIFIIGNGGLMDVSSHGSADLSRLIPNKSFYSFNNAGFITSNANDHGYNNVFLKWLDATVYRIENPYDTLIIGLSCSGNSENICRALNVMHDRKYDTFLLSGQKSVKLNNEITELCLGVKYFHTCEIICMMLFYSIVYQTGNHCPDINTEIKRKSGKIAA